MPLYEYRCSKCEKTFEIIQKFSDEPLTAHEACGGPVERLISAPALQFKGSGWYITDYARSGGNKADSKSGEAKTETKSESKSEAKSDSGSSSSSTPATTASPSSSSTPAAPSK